MKKNVMENAVAEHYCLMHDDAESGVQDAGCSESG